MDISNNSLIPNCDKCHACFKPLQELTYTESYKNDKPCILNVCNNCRENDILCCPKCDIPHEWKPEITDVNQLQHLLYMAHFKIHLMLVDIKRSKRSNDNEHQFKDDLIQNLTDTVKQLLQKLEDSEILNKTLQHLLSNQEDNDDLETGNKSEIENDMNKKALEK